MPTINVFELLIRPVGEALQSDPRFRGIKIFYDRSRERKVPANQMPAINYFLEAPWEDIMRGSGASSLQTRRMDVRIAFGIWVYGPGDAAELDSRLFEISGNLFDFFRETTEFDRTNGVFLNAINPIRWDVDYSGEENGLVGTQKLTVEYMLLSGTGR